MFPIRKQIESIQSKRRDKKEQSNKLEIPYKRGKLKYIYLAGPAEWSSQLWNQAVYLVHVTPSIPNKFTESIKSHPQRLSLLELVLDEESVSMVRRRMSPATGSSGNLGDSTTAALIQGWSQICSNVGRSEGRKARHHLISCWHSGKGQMNNISPLTRTLCSGDSLCVDLQYATV